MSSCFKCSFKPLPWCASLEKYVYNKALCTISHWHASLIPLFIFAAMCPGMDAIMPDGDAVSLSAGQTLFDPALWQKFAQDENNSLLRLQIQYVLNASLPKWLMAQCKSWKIPICSSMTKCGYAPPRNTRADAQTHTHLLAISDLLVYNTLNPELFCTAFDKHQVFSSEQNDFYGLKRQRHGGLGDEIQLFTFISPSFVSLLIIPLHFLSTWFIRPIAIGWGSFIKVVEMVREELSHLKSGLVIAVSKNVEVRQ